MSGVGCMCMSVVGVCMSVVGCMCGRCVYEWVGVCV